MNCKEALDKIYAYLDKDCTSCSMEEIEAHLKHCRPCWDRCEFERQLLARFKKSCACEDLPAKLKEKIKKLLGRY